MQASPYSELAKQFLALWQQQMGTVMNDRAFISSLMEMMQTMHRADTPTDAARHAKPSSHAAVSPNALLERLDQLDYRLRMLETRAGAASQKPRAKRSGAASRPAGTARRRSATPAAKPAKKR